MLPKYSKVITWNPVWKEGQALEDREVGNPAIWFLGVTEQSRKAHESERLAKKDRFSENKDRRKGEQAHIDANAQKGASKFAPKKGRFFFWREKVIILLVCV